MPDGDVSEHDPDFNYVEEEAEDNEEIDDILEEFKFDRKTRVTSMLLINFTFKPLFQHTPTPRVII